MADSIFMMFAICNNGGTLCLGSSLGVKEYRRTSVQSSEPHEDRRVPGVGDGYSNDSPAHISKICSAQGEGKPDATTGGAAERGNLNRSAGAAVLLPVAGCHQWRF
jgi:hypothetical protein